MASQLLRIPLLGKLIGANAVVVLLALGAVALGVADGADRSRMLLVLSAALFVGLVVNLTLVTLALRPIQELERTVWRIWHGESAARVPHSPIADADLDRVGDTLNVLLDSLEQDRVRMHGLASEVIRAEDRERSRIGRELHDSIAQSLAALIYQVAAAENVSSDPLVTDRLRSIRVLAGEILDEVDALSQTVHPRVLNDLGLVAGLRHIARTVGGDPPKVDVEILRGSEEGFRTLDPDVATVIYRVAQEAVQNAMRHSGADRVTLSLSNGGGAVTLVVNDRGRGFDLGEAQRRRPGMGLFTMRERVALVDGDFSIVTGLGEGTSVRVSIPIADRAILPPAPAMALAASN